MALLAGLLFLGLLATEGTPCPGLRPAAELREMKGDDAEAPLLAYALMRLAKCGWREAEPAFRVAYAEMRFGIGRGETRMGLRPRPLPPGAP